MKSALLSSVSHDLRTPLAVIKGAATDLLDPTVMRAPAAQLDLLHVLHSLPTFTHPDLIVGTETSDDAGVFRLREDLAIVNTVVPSVTWATLSPTTIRRFDVLTCQMMLSPEVRLNISR